MVTPLGSLLGVTIRVDGWMRAGHEDRLHRRRTVDGVDRREPTRQERECAVKREERLLSLYN
jgi:hypothetical protein